MTERLGARLLPPFFGALLWGSALLTQSASADQPTSSCKDCPEMVTIPAGSYLMGKTIDYGYGDMDGPSHTVTIPQPFAMAVREVTLGEYRKFIRDSGYVPARKCNIYKEDAKWFIEPKRSWDAPGFKQGEDHPVVCVSWLDAQAYIKWLNARTGQNYRLPSEAEWEYVATLADLGDVRGGGAVTHEIANIGKVECCGGETGGKDVWMHTAPVGSFPKDRFGLHDIRGNVWEWQSDCFQQDYFDAPTDGRSREVCPKMGYHVVRGASYGDGGEYLSERLRLQGTEDHGYFTVGFRLAQSLHPSPGGEPSTPASIAQPVTNMLAAIRQRDVNALDGVLARTTDPEILYYWGDTVSGRKPIGEWHREWFQEQGWVLWPEKLLHVFVDGNLAQVNHTVEYIKSADRKFNIFFASTLIREADGWKVARIQQTLLEGPK